MYIVANDVYDLTDCCERTTRANEAVSERFSDLASFTDRFVSERDDGRHRTTPNSPMHNG